MGIKDLNPLITIEAPDAIMSVSAKKFSGTRVAFDMGIVMHKTYYGAVNHVLDEMKGDIEFRDPTDAEVITWWVRQTIIFFKLWLKQNILPVLVWDGKPSIHKEDVVEDRAKILAEKLEAVRIAREKLRECKEGSMRRFAHSELFSKMKNLNYISKEIRQKYKTIFSTIGFPSFQAEEEADPLCVSLCLDYHTSAAYSTDSDFLTHGIPYLITEFNDKSNKFKIFSLQKVLEGFNLPQDQFIDLCITLKCDYNKRIRGIGKVKALQRIREYGYIDYYPTDKDTSCLKTDICRDMFRYKPWYEMTDDNNFEVNITEESVNILKELGFVGDTAKLFEMMDDFKHSGVYTVEL